jgi:hypothetical protein
VKNKKKYFFEFDFLILKFIFCLISLLSRNLESAHRGDTFKKSKKNDPG